MELPSFAFGCSPDDQQVKHYIIKHIEVFIYTFHSEKQTNISVLWIMLQLDCLSFMLSYIAFQLESDSLVRNKTKQSNVSLCFP
ncbi:CLUMA_CG005769, isoform A [Clunio marinus]|uniref:CLUMA_CG005769, isoform A n=1 Tax=Clunio marinus TaxID=568069 RepID=A0A1J1I1G0_9DIPT|nr:CLUMA_CG005769, isoform A [Clunio marinus]